MSLISAVAVPLVASAALLATTGITVTTPPPYPPAAYPPSAAIRAPEAGSHPRTDRSGAWPGAARSAARSAPGAAPATAAHGLTWQWPVRPRPVVARGFRLGPEPWSPGHRGVDLLAHPGSAVAAPAAGVVTFAGQVAGRPVISIGHGHGLVSSLEPVSALARTGDQVSAGQVIGRLSGVPGHCYPASCLHWGVRASGRYVDPLALLGARAGPVILLPDHLGSRH